MVRRDTRLKDVYKTGTADDNEAEPKWIPTYVIPLTRPDRAGTLAAVPNPHLVTSHLHACIFGVC